MYETVTCFGCFFECIFHPTTTINNWLCVCTPLDQSHPRNSMQDQTPNCVRLAQASQSNRAQCAAYRAIHTPHRQKNRTHLTHTNANTHQQYFTRPSAGIWMAAVSRHRVMFKFTRTHTNTLATAPRRNVEHIAIQQALAHWALTARRTPHWCDAHVCLFAACGTETRKHITSGKCAGGLSRGGCTHTHTHRRMLAGNCYPFAAACVLLFPIRM